MKKILLEDRNPIFSLPTEERMKILNKTLRDLHILTDGIDFTEPEYNGFSKNDNTLKTEIIKLRRKYENELIGSGDEELDVEEFASLIGRNIVYQIVVDDLEWILSEEEIRCKSL